ncbi:2Fe-2S ferredoxin [Candidatus Fokinia solitaria]|uniref:Adrenodoxin-like protein n=1 Tax=Candidatus Fokinia solitaria TaxID=1802984 RepID=A0A2U8BSR3_9RICK|nr:ferredoxin family 2Fe-2S iron-sulfur cluster binding protein [Candidatus Fokinia solitaria]AWD33338.1 2Fe-2S ferredoxin [Candidatus Fokinia solitaria]
MKEVTLHFFDKDSNKITVQATVGLSILEIARKFHIPIEGACEGALACSTCHIILEQETYAKLSKPSSEEDDMLDLAFGLTSTSRLGCQVIVTPELNNAIIKLPRCTRNMLI